MFRRSHNAMRPVVEWNSDAKPFTKTCVPQHEDIPSLLRTQADLAAYAPRFVEEQIGIEH